MRALVIEDDAAIRDVIVRALLGGGYDVVGVATGDDGDARLADEIFDVVVVDWNLPGLSGVEIVRRLRVAGSATAVLMLTGRDDVNDRVIGLDSGADDYLVKPFFIDELLARVRSIVRRNGTRSSAHLVEGEIALDGMARSASVGGRPIALSAREYALLEHLLRNAGIALAREEIEERVWGNAFETSSNVLDVMIGRVRKKLGVHAASIETLRGHGYRFKRGPVNEP